MDAPFAEQLTELAECLARQCEETDWTRIGYEINAVHDMVADAVFYEETGQEFDVETDEEDDPSVLACMLREDMYEAEPAKGAWYSMSMELLPDGRFTVRFNYDDKPEDMDESVTDESYFLDTEIFPRDAAHTPAWLAEIIAHHTKQ